MTNLMVLPGLGSWILGKSTGLIQMALALSGFGLTAFWAVWFIKTWIGVEHLPNEIGPHFGKALLGILLFLVAWFWALGTSIGILRKTDVKKDL